jgi:hypothetical protein
MAKSAGKEESYSGAEAKRRFEAALRGGLNTLPKPLRDIPKENGESRVSRKKRKRKT